MAILARKRMGKSNTAKVLVEQLFKAGQQGRGRGSKGGDAARAGYGNLTTKRFVNEGGR